MNFFLKTDIHKRELSLWIPFLFYFPFLDIKRVVPLKKGEYVSK